MMLYKKIGIFFIFKYCLGNLVDPNLKPLPPDARIIDNAFFAIL